jgi:hypothetical protein
VRSAAIKAYDFWIDHRGRSPAGSDADKTVLGVDGEY